MSEDVNPPEPVSSDNVQPETLSDHFQDIVGAVEIAGTEALNKVEEVSATIKAEVKKLKKDLNTAATEVDNQLATPAVAEETPAPPVAPATPPKAKHGDDFNNFHMM